jgi:acyl dehydratase
MGTHFFEDFQLDMVITSPTRTITETDVVMFSGLSGDYNLIHTDENYAQKTHFGQRVAHGLLGLSIATGLIARTGVMDGSVVALLGINNWKFVNPIFIGDTVFARFKVTEKRVSNSNPDVGIVNRFYELVNQRGEVLQQGEMPVMVLKRSSAAAKNI